MKKLNNKGFGHIESLLTIVIMFIVVGAFMLVASHANNALKNSASSASTSPATKAASVGFVHQSGTQLLDGNNEPLTLRGVNLGGYLSWEGWIWGKSFDYIGETAMMNNLTSLVGQTQADQFQTGVYNDFITSADFGTIAANGLNAVRVPFNYKLLEDDSNPGVYKQSGWTVLDNIVNEAKANHIYVILDMHATPCGQNFGFTSDYTGSSLLWWNSECQTRTVNLWKAIAQRYSSQNIIAGFDLINEPQTSNANLLSLYQRITSAIRQVDKNHMIIYEGNDLAHSFSLFTTPLDNNEMLSAHDYSWSGPPGGLTSLNSAAAKVKAPMWIGEFGQANTSTVQRQVDQFKSDPYIAGWADWTYKQTPGFPSLETINESTDAKLLIEYINNTKNTKPTQAQAEQGISDFLNEIKLNSNTQNTEMGKILAD